MDRDRETHRASGRRHPGSKGRVFRWGVYARVEPHRPLESVMLRLPHPAAPEQLGLVMPLGGDRYELACDPVNASAPIRWGDEFEAITGHDQSLLYRALVEESPFRTGTFSVSNTVAQRADVQRLLARVVSDGGRWQYAWGALHIEVRRWGPIKPLAELAEMAVAYPQWRPGLRLTPLPASSSARDVATILRLTAPCLARKGWNKVRVLDLAVGEPMLRAARPLERCAEALDAIAASRRHNMYVISPRDRVAVAVAVARLRLAAPLVPEDGELLGRYADAIEQVVPRDDYALPPNALAGSGWRAGRQPRPPALGAIPSR